MTEVEVKDEVLYLNTSKFARGGLAKVFRGFPVTTLSATSRVNVDELRSISDISGLEKYITDDLAHKLGDAIMKSDLARLLVCDDHADPLGDYREYRAELDVIKDK